jgi:hypothetical protein
VQSHLLPALLIVTRRAETLGSGRRSRVERVAEGSAQRTLSYQFRLVLTCWLNTFKGEIKARKPVGNMGGEVTGGACPRPRLIAVKRYIRQSDVAGNGGFDVGGEGVLIDSGHFIFGT